MIKTFKVLIISMMCVLLVLSMCACGNESSQTATEPVNSNAQSTTQATAPEAQPETSAGAAGEGEPVDPSYFDNAAFVGDSVSLKLSYYAAATDALGNAQFFTAGSLGSANALWEVSGESVHPSYQGVKMTVEDCVANSGAEVVYIMLGMNDIGLYGIEDSVKNYKTLAEKILEKSPAVKIVVQSMTPMTDTSEILGESLNNENIKVYNEKLRELCTQQGWAFVDVASVMYDAEGKNLNRDFCSDPDGLGVHFTEAGCEKWVEYLSTHVPA
ncbi:MAG: hypothetical protein IJA62_01080 [Ruminococcus sp.]|nr:hypothetical protein [Ruminococcus sp.]